MTTNPATPTPADLPEPLRLAALMDAMDYADTRAAAVELRRLHAFSAAAPSMAAYDYPAGAIVNGRTHIDRLESVYRFDCEAGPLALCDDWQGLKRCFEHLADSIGRTSPAASQAEQPGAAVPDGWKLVPVEPTREMCDAAVQAICYGTEGGFTRISGPGKSWVAMFAAAPAAPMSAQPSETDIKALAYQHLQAHARTEGGVWYEGEVAFARAVLARWGAPAPTTEQAGSDCDEERCSYCDGTGDVHDLNGEWRGTCHCPAGQRENARITTVLAAPGGEAPAPAAPTDKMVDAYLSEQRRVVEEADRFGRPNVGGLHTNTVREACRAGIAAAMAAQGQEGAA